MRKASEIASAFGQREALEGKRDFFLVGIGGAGMSALARMLKHRGYRVRGTDSTPSPEVQRLRDEGIQVQVGHSGADIQQDDAVVLTDAIELESSPEVLRARELGIALFRRSQVLGWLLKDHKVIAVTGTHGKTTTTGMVGAGLIAAGLEPTVVVGASVPEFGGPVVEGTGDWAVVEACEAYDSFHDLDPDVVLLTNLEMDHSDFHGNWTNLKASVKRFADRASQLIFCEDDPGAAEVAAELRVPSTAYGGYVPGLSMSGLPGKHNHLNAFGALLAAKATGVDTDLAAEGIKKFRGAERRLQVLQDGQITVIDDYAHHPTEIDASLSAIREAYPGRRLIVAFQPHLYSRTAENIPQFADALNDADVVFITDIYPAREAPIPGISSSRIAELIDKETHYVPSRHLLPRRVAVQAQSGDVVVGMGAGTISEFAPALIAELRRVDLPLESRKIAVVFGGDSSEREVSILSGREIQASLQRQGIQSVLVDISELLLSGRSLEMFSGVTRPDLAFLAVHGTNSEDGAVQGLFELLHVPYTGSGVQASAIAMNKALTKQILAQNGLLVPQGKLISTLEDAVGLTAPAVVKPNAEGSTVGLTFVEDEDQMLPAVRKALAHGGACLVEEWLRGMEISVPVLGDRPLPPVEIAPASGYYDFASKYTPGATQEIVPARLPQEVLERAQEIALRAHQLLGCEGASRTDMIVSEDRSTLHVLEVNTLPGMTQTSLLPNSARAAGIEFDELVRWLVQDAIDRYAAKT